MNLLNAYSRAMARARRKATRFCKNENFRNRYYPRDDGAFMSEVRSALYDGVNVTFDNLRNHHSLAALAAMLMAAGPSSRTEVTTFNWDDLLEYYLEFHGYVAVSVYDKFWAESADVTIFHPHGFLPYFKSMRSNELVFDQYSYSQIMGSETLWKQTLLHSFRTRTCILVGLSGGGPNLDVALMRARDDHASKNNNTLYWGVTLTTDRTTSARWEKA